MEFQGDSTQEPTSAFAGRDIHVKGTAGTGTLDGSTGKGGGATKAPPSTQVPICPRPHEALPLNTNLVPPELASAFSLSEIERTNQIQFTNYLMLMNSMRPMNLPPNKDVRQVSM